MLDAARCYLVGSPEAWPWGKRWWKPKTEEIERLSRAGVGDNDLVAALALLDAAVKRMASLQNPGIQPPYLIDGKVADVSYIKTSEHKY